MVANVNNKFILRVLKVLNLAILDSNFPVITHNQSNNLQLPTLASTHTVCVREPLFT